MRRWHGIIQLYTIKTEQAPIANKTKTMYMENEIELQLQIVEEL